MYNKINVWYLQINPEFEKEKHESKEFDFLMDDKSAVFYVKNFRNLK